jgi:hypothetical protein
MVGLAYTILFKEKIYGYSQDPTTGRPISGKSQYPDTFVFGYRIKITQPITKSSHLVS